MANPNKRVVLPPGLGCYAFIFEPRDPPAGQTGDPKFSIALLWPKAKQAELLKDLKAAIFEVAVAKFGKSAELIAEQFKAGKLKYPIHDGNTERPDDPVFADMVFVTASSTTQPGIVDRAVKPVFEKDEAYSGCTFRASVSVFAYDNVSKGVGLGLSNLQVVTKGPRLDGRRNAEQDFADYKDESAAAVDTAAPTDAPPPADKKPPKPVVDLL
jgi:hypothetical protein